jgi:hypothetical protein
LRSARIRLTLLATFFVACTSVAQAQPVEVRQWQGVSAVTRQPGQVVATTLAEWRSLWSRVGIPAPPEHFEPGRMNAVGIFLGSRGSTGYVVNVLSAARRRDRIVVLFEERTPPEMMMVQRRAVVAPPAQSLAPPPPQLAPGPSGLGSSFAPSAPGGGPTPSLPPVPPRPPTQATSPWAIVLINRADLPISVEQRMFR